jgi:hypothetical protein
MVTCIFERYLEAGYHPYGQLATNLSARLMDLERKCSGEEQTYFLYKIVTILS